MDRDGLAVVEDAVTAAELIELTEAVDRVYEAECADGPLHRLAFAGLDPSFLKLVAHPVTLPLVTGALGWNIQMYHCHLDVHPVTEVSELGKWRWHQDGGRQNVDLESPRPRLSLKVAYFLTDVPSSRHGPLWVLPGSHTRDTLEQPANGSPQPDGAVPLLLSRGTAVVLDRRLWHARGDNRVGAARKALFYAYTYRWIRPRDDLGLDPGTVATLDPVTRQLLGSGTSEIGHWIPTDDDVPLREASIR